MYIVSLVFVFKMYCVGFLLFIIFYIVICGIIEYWVVFEVVNVFEFKFGFCYIWL